MQCTVHGRGNGTTVTGSCSLTAALFNHQTDIIVTAVKAWDAKLQNFSQNLFQSVLKMPGNVPPAAVTTGAGVCCRLMYGTPIQGWLLRNPSPLSPVSSVCP